ncbi:MAG: choice-of-anchor Q domain-containing protein [Chthoniobacterales bacterium]
MHAQLLARNKGIDVPDGTRKCIKPQDRASRLTNPSVPLTCLAPVVNVSAATGNQAESFVNVNPTNPNNLVAFSNTNANSIFRAYSTNGGATWTRGTVATGVACCDAQAAWDRFGNLFLVYINNSLDQINVILSTDGGVTFGVPVTVGTGSVDQPSIAVGNGSVWVDWNSSGSMVARGAPVTGLGVWGPFNALQSIPSATGSFGGIAVGPGPNGGKVIVTYQNPTGGQGPATIYTNVDTDGLGAGGFGAQVAATSTNVGGFDFIPAQNGRSIDAEAGVVWDATGGPFNNRIYLVYTEETVNENNDTDILMRTSTNDGATWSAPVRVNDDPAGPIRSQFLPYVALDPTTGTVAVGFHDCRNDNGVPGSGGTNNIPNDDAEYYGTYSTDGGATWAPNVRLSGGFSNAAASGNGIDFGDYIGLSAFAGKLYPGWADNANCDGTNANGTLQAFDLYANSNSLVLPVAPPNILTVNKTADTNDGVCNAADCSLREAVAVAGSDGATDLILFNIPANNAGCVGTDCTITLTSPLAPAADGGRLTTINGYTGPNTITLSGNGATQIFNLGTGVNLSASNLNFTGSNGNNGNAAVTIASDATMTITNSALFGNTNTSVGGALTCNSGGVLNLTNVTISGNQSANGGGINNSGTVTANSLTVTNNSGGFGGGGVSNGGTFNVRNTIIAGNSSAVAANADASGTFASQGYNLIGKADGASGFTAVGDQTGTVALPLNPLLGTFGNNGGPTRTHALQSGSPAINAGDNTNAPAYDQRYLLRNGATDIGAYEFNGLTPSVTITSITRPANGHIILQGLGVANSPHTVQVSSDLISGFSYLATVMSNGAGAVQFDDAGAVGATKRFYRLTFP